MRLVRIKEAAKVAYVTDSMICHWVRNGRIQKFPMAGFKNRYEVDLDEVIRASKTTKFTEKREDNLISRIEAANLLYVGERTVSYYVQMGYIKPHYVFGNKKHYLVDRDEVLAQRELMPDRIKHTARLEEISRQAKEMPRDENGHWAKRA